MKYKFLFLLIFSAMILALGGCQKQYLTGYFTKAEFIKSCEWNSKIYDRYKPSKRWIDSLKTINGPIDVTIFLGSYCPDSKKLVPRYFSLSKGLPLNEPRIISVDTTKIDEKGLAPANDIKKIPTFIFYKESKEIGRIVEESKGRIEKRIFLILQDL